MSAEPGKRRGALQAKDWEELLSERLSHPVRVAYGRSRTNPLQARRPRAPRAPRPGAEVCHWEVRLHEMFAEAPAEICTAVAELLRARRGRSRSRAMLEGWIAEQLASLPARTISDAAIETRGRCHDLATIAADLIAHEMHGDFSGDVPAPRISWGRTGGRRMRRGMRLGSYDAEISLVRVHPALDQPAVPGWFVRYVLFHELLHAVHPPVQGEDGRWIRHGREFRRRERAYPDLDRALGWERDHIDTLIRSARRSRPMRARKPTATRGLVQRLLFPEA